MAIAGALEGSGRYFITASRSGYTPLFLRELPQSKGTASPVIIAFLTARSIDAESIAWTSSDRYRSPS